MLRFLPGRASASSSPATRHLLPGSVQLVLNRSRLLNHSRRRLPGATLLGSQSGQDFDARFIPTPDLGLFTMPCWDTSESQGPALAGANRPHHRYDAGQTIRGGSGGARRLFFCCIRAARIPRVRLSTSKTSARRGEKPWRCAEALLACSLQRQHPPESRNAPQRRSLDGTDGNCALAQISGTRSLSR
jgi:hypothetical protein